MDIQNMKKLIKETHPNISELVRWNDHHFVILDKPAGIPVQPDLTGDKSLLDLGEIYIKSQLHLITRLDRPASGLVVLGKSKDAVGYYKSLNESQKVSKKYVVLVEGIVEKEEDELIHHLLHHKSSKKSQVYETEREGTKVAKLKYKTIEKLERYSILEVEIASGRFHQIRAQLAFIGYPIKGDVKYRAKRSNKDKSIYLSCYDISFKTKSNDKLIEGKAIFNTEDNLWKIINEKINGGEKAK